MPKGRAFVVRDIRRSSSLSRAKQWQQIAAPRPDAARLDPSHHRPQSPHSV